MAKTPKTPKVAAAAKKPTRAQARAQKEANITESVEAWKKTMPGYGGSGSWSEWGKAKPGRSTRAAQVLGNSAIPTGTSDRKPEEKVAALENWSAERPFGGSGEQWKRHGASYPARKSRASKILREPKKTGGSPDGTEQPTV